MAVLFFCMAIVSIRDTANLRAPTAGALTQVNGRSDLIVRNGYAPADYDHGPHMGLVDGQYDVCGDGGGVVCVPTHGHTPAINR